MLAWLERYQWLVLTLSVVVFGAIALGPGLLDRDDRPLDWHNDSSLAPGTPIRVHVAGAVLAPGVYELREGDRVVDALTAAGGPADDADSNELNLARRVRDEEQIVVPRHEASTTAAPALLLATGARLDINTATLQQLDQLPGIGEAYSRRIVDSRAVDGPFATTDDLVGRKIVPRATFERIRDLVGVGP